MNSGARLRCGLLSRCGRWLVLVILCGFLAETALAEPCCEQGLLFRLDPEVSAQPSSWLFGTMHSDDPRVTRLPAPVLAAFDSALGVVLEVVPDAAMQEASRAAMVLSPGERLSEQLPPAVYQEILIALSERGIPQAAAERLAPWAILLVLSMPPPSSAPVLDLVLYQRAAELDKPVVGLESIAEQLSVFQALSLEEQVVLLESTLRHRAQLPQIFAALLDAYLDGDLVTLMRLGQTLAAEDPELDERLRRALIDDRNRRMFARLVPMLQQGRQFIAVGALHLPGPGGLLQRLQAAGVEVTRVY
ncbi:TraB/GumN family protein [Halochromatium roseum]|uniref:TraB/GumN family protein n=1 Tax=Halochromatium roseum TaxID=391920 RepID=UPI0019136D16|nr:TraB/GumN family protein [Halochromatium roseum]